MTHSMVSTFDLERDSSSFRLLPLLSLTIAISTFLEGRFGTVVAFSFIISVLLNIHTIIRILRRLSIGKFKKNELIYSNPIRARLQGILVEKGKVIVGFCLKMIGLDAEMGFTGTPTPAPVQK